MEIKVNTVISIISNIITIKKAVRKEGAIILINSLVIRNPYLVRLTFSLF